MDDGIFRLRIAKHVHQREHTVKVELCLGKFGGMFQAIIHKRVEVIEGFVVVDFGINHAKDCNRQIMRKQEESMNIGILSNFKRCRFVTLAFLIIALLASCVTPSITSPTITVTSIPSTYTPQPTENSALPPLSPEIIDLLHNGGTYDRSQNGFVDKYDQLRFELEAGQWKPLAVPTKQIVQY